jgi:hypothetical protein
LDSRIDPRRLSCGLISRSNEERIRIGASTTVERAIVLTVAGVTQSVEVRGTDSRLEARVPGFSRRRSWIRDA